MGIQRGTLSTTMGTTVMVAMQYGKLERRQGGFWTYPGCPSTPHNGVPTWYVGASTIQALVARGRLIYSEYQEGRRHKFPIAATPAPKP